MMTKRVRIPITFWSLAFKVITELKPEYKFVVVSTTNSIVLLESTMDGFRWLYELSFVMMNDMNVSSNYRVTARRAWWRLKYLIDASDLVTTDVICVDGVYVHLSEKQA
jgi:hypothetical protein